MDRVAVRFVVIVAGGVEFGVGDVDVCACACAVGGAMARRASWLTEGPVVGLGVESCRTALVVGFRVDGSEWSRRVRRVVGSRVRVRCWHWDIRFCVNPLEVAGRYNLTCARDQHEAVDGVHAPLWGDWYKVGGAQIKPALVSDVGGFVMMCVV